MITTNRTQDLLGTNAAKLEKITPICAGIATHQNLALVISRPQT